MDRVVILGLIAALSGASASQAFGQLGPLGPAAAPTADLPGASIHSVGPLAGAPAQPLPQPPASFRPAPMSNHPSPVMPLPTPGFVGASSFDAGGLLGTGSLAGMPLAGAPLPDQAAGPFQHDFSQPGPAGGAGSTYLSPNPAPKAPQNLGLYRPSFPEGIEARKLSPLPSVSVREYPYLRRGQSTDKFITPPGMEMPEAIGPTASPLTWSDRLRNLIDPLGVLPLP